MGCNVTKDIPVSANAKSSKSADGLFHEPSSGKVKGLLQTFFVHIVNLSNIEINALKDFKVTHTDFIKEKAGRIEHEYSLLSPAIGRGIKILGCIHAYVLGWGELLNV